jgi:4-aminobutyrate aminotransferase
MTATDLTTPAAREEVIRAAFRRGLLLIGCGERAVRFCPPLCVTAGQIETGLRLFDDSLAEVGAGRFSQNRVSPIEAGSYTV